AAVAAALCDRMAARAAPLSPPARRRPHAAARNRGAGDPRGAGDTRARASHHGDHHRRDARGLAPQTRDARLRAWIVRCISAPSSDRIVERDVVSRSWHPMAIAGLVSVIVAGAAGRCRGARRAEDPATRAAVPAAGAQQATPARTLDPLENFPPRTIEPTMVPNTPPPTPAADTPAVPPTRATAAAAAALSCK